MGRIYCAIDKIEVIINYPVDESGHYLIEWNGAVIGHLFIDGIREHSHLPFWKGTTAAVNLFAEEIGSFILKSHL